MRITSSDVRRLVADYYGVTKSQLEGRRRARPYVWPRQVAMTLCRHYTRLSMPQIGRIFGRDHTTVLNGIRMVNNRVALYRIHKLELAELCEQIEAGKIVTRSIWARAVRRPYASLAAIDETDPAALVERITYAEALAAAHADFSNPEARPHLPASVLPGARLLRQLRSRAPGLFAEEISQ